ncbi:MAG: DKNYY domain-containing protein [bacterium]|nr:DKNYY domain-containing protein [bacterium]
MNKKYLLTIVGIIVVLVISYIVFNLSNSNISSSGIQEFNPKDAVYSQKSESSWPVYFKYQGGVYFSSTGFGSRGTPEVVEGADPGSFQERRLATGEEYGVDKNFVYCAGHKIEGSDGQTFNDKDPNYTFDKNQVYYPYCRIVEGVDISSFKIVSPGVYAVDKNNVYKYGQIIQGAEAESVRNQYK